MCNLQQIRVMQDSLSDELTCLLPQWCLNLTEGQAVFIAAP